MKLPRHDRAKEFAAVLEERLPRKTFKHVVSVARLMETIADRCDLPHDEAVAAGLLHDYCKAVKNEDLLAAAERYGIPVSPVCLDRPTLLHGPVAAEEIRRDLDVTGDDVYEAVYCHTFGKPGLGLLGQALYVADFSEELRPYPEADVARGLLQRNGLAAALRYVTNAKLDHLRRKDRPIDPASLAFRDWVHESWPA